MNDFIDRQAAIDIFDVGAEILRRVVDDQDIVSNDREKYEWGLNLIELYITDMKELPPAQPEYEELTPEEAASEIASGSLMSAKYWLDTMIRLKQMGYAICRKK